MAVDRYEDLLPHIGHKTTTIFYGDYKNPDNVAVECERCNIVILDFDRPESHSGRTDWELLKRQKARLVEVAESDELLQGLLNWVDSVQDICAETLGEKVVYPRHYYECGICGAYHPWLWNGDCREDEYRIYDLPDDAEVFTMEERVATDLDGKE